MTDAQPTITLSDAIEAFPLDRLLRMEFRTVEGTGKKKIACMCPVGVMADTLGYNWRTFDIWYRASQEEKTYQGDDESVRRTLLDKVCRLQQYKGVSVSYIIDHVTHNSPLNTNDISRIFQIILTMRTRPAQEVKDEIVSFLREKGL